MRWFAPVLVGLACVQPACVYHPPRLTQAVADTASDLDSTFGDQDPSTFPTECLPFGASINVPFQSWAASGGTIVIPVQETSTTVEVGAYASNPQCDAVWLDSVPARDCTHGAKPCYDSTGGVVATWNMPSSLVPVVSVKGVIRLTSRTDPTRTGTRQVDMTFLPTGIGRSFFVDPAQTTAHEYPHPDTPTTFLGAITQARTLLAAGAAPSVGIYVKKGDVSLEDPFDLPAGAFLAGSFTNDWTLPVCGCHGAADLTWGSAAEDGPRWLYEAVPDCRDGRTRLTRPASGSPTAPLVRIDMPDRAPGAVIETGLQGVHLEADEASAKNEVLLVNLSDTNTNPYAIHLWQSELVSWGTASTAALMTALVYQNVDSVTATLLVDVRRTTFSARGTVWSGFNATDWEPTFAFGSKISESCIQAEVTGAADGAHLQYFDGPIEFERSAIGVLTTGGGTDSTTRGILATMFGNAVHSALSITGSQVLVSGDQSVGAIVAGDYYGGAPVQAASVTDSRIVSVTTAANLVPPGAVVAMATQALDLTVERNLLCANGQRTDRTGLQLWPEGSVAMTATVNDNTINAEVPGACPPLGNPPSSTVGLNHAVTINPTAGVTASSLALRFTHNLLCGLPGEGAGGWAIFNDYGVPVTGWFRGNLVNTVECGFESIGSIWSSGVAVHGVGNPDEAFLLDSNYIDGGRHPANANTANTVVVRDLDTPSPTYSWVRAINNVLTAPTTPFHRNDTGFCGIVLDARFNTFLVDSLDISRIDSQPVVYSVPDALGLCFDAAYGDSILEGNLIVGRTFGSTVPTASDWTSASFYGNSVVGPSVSITSMDLNSNTNATLAPTGGSLDFLCTDEDRRSFNPHLSDSALVTYAGHLSKLDILDEGGPYSIDIDGDARGDPQGSVLVFRGVDTSPAGCPSRPPPPGLPTF